MQLKLIIALCFLIGLVSSLFGKSTVYKSAKYGYSINKPLGFEIKQAKGIHIDYKISSQDGSSILVNVSERVPEEKNLDGHSYSKAYFEQMFRQVGSNNAIEKTEKIVVDGVKVFLLYYGYTRPSGISFKVIEAYFFIGNNAYVITTTSDVQHYTLHRSTFLTTINSFKRPK